MVEKKDKVRLKQYIKTLCEKCGCGAKSPNILEVTDTHVIQINYLGIKETIALEDYDVVMKSAGIYNKALDDFLNQSMTEKEVNIRRKRLKVLSSAEKGATSPETKEKQEPDT